MSEIANGFSWYKFDIDGWLSSPDVQQMSMAERGMYHHLLTIQARDGKLTADIRALARQAGVDRRVLVKWLQKWGYLFPIIGISPNVELASVQHPCNIHVTSMQHGCSMCVTPVLPLRCFPAASWMHACSMRVNPKLWNLSVKSGKFDGQPLLEEKREDLDLDGKKEGDWSQVIFTLKSKTPVVRGEGA